MPEPQEPKKKGGVKRARGVFPRLQLSRTLELPQKMYEIGKGEAVRRLTVVDRLGKAPDGGTTRTLIVASNSGYGLTSGSYNSDFLSFTENGLRLVSATTELERFKAIYAVLFSNEIFSGLVSRFKDRGIPDDEVVRDYLIQNYGLSFTDAAACWEVAKDNLTEYNLVQSFSGKSLIVTQEVALEKIGHNSRKTAEIQESIVPESEPVPETHVTHLTEKSKKSTHSEQIMPQFTFNIQIVLPENASPETYDNIFKSISVHLLHRDNG